MLNTSNFLALIGGGNKPKYTKNKVVIWDDYENEVISEIKILNPIINFKLKKDLLFIICQKKIYIFDFNTYDLIEKIDTGDNVRGLFAINNNPDFTIMAYPAIKDLNKISLKKIKEEKPYSYILNDENIGFLTINYDGNLIAVANDKGTLVKIYNCKNGELLKEFERGRSKVEYIFVCFDNKNKFMAISSNKGTIHIFSMKGIFEKIKENDNTINEKNNKNNINESNQKNDELILPDNDKSFFGNTEKGFAKVKTNSKTKNICSFVGKNMIIVISYDNKYYQAEIDIQKGGNCKIIEEKNLNNLIKK